MTELRPEIALSWKRSRMCGLDPGDTPEPTLLAPSDAAGRLLRAARPVLDELGTQLSGADCGILLVDRECRVVARYFDSVSMERAMDGLGVLTGAELSEEVFGTNALGTPLEMRRELVVHGEEHFLEPLKGFSCYGHPLVHPVTRRIEGILDITAAGRTANPLFAPVVARAARDIEARLLEGAREADRRVVDAFQRAAQRRGLAVAAMGEDIMLTNKAAVELLVPTDHAALRTLAADLGSGQCLTVDFDLASGGSTGLRIERIPGIDSGALFLLDATGDRVPVRRATSRSPRPRGLRDELARLASGPGPLAVTGEPGSGRTWASRELTGDEPVVLDAARIVAEGERAWSARLLAAVESDAGTDVIVEHVHAAPDSVLTLLTSLLSSDPRLVFTCDPPDTVREPVRALLGRCTGTVRIPALRHRIHELGDLAAALAQDLGRIDLRFGPGALDVLAERAWPGNLAELRAVLAGIPPRESALPLRAEDFAPEHRGTGRVAKLGGLERAEREAIIDALRANGGNKVRAAAQLGISRTTLYSRIKALDIA